MKTDDEFRKIQIALRGSSCFAFKKSDVFFLYREVMPKNTLAVKSKSLNVFREKASIASGVKLP